jgi:DNA polymerase-3 subunit delta'
MRVEGSNAFLKSIEEPPKNSQIILITSNIDKIIQTIKSRCYQIEFKKRTINDLYNVYSKVYNTNFFNISIEKQNELFKSHSDMIYKNILFDSRFSS